MLSTNTTFVLVMMKFHMMQIPSSMSPETPSILLRQMREHAVGINWLVRLNVSISLRFKVCTFMSTLPVLELVLPQWLNCRMESVGVMAKQSAHSLDAWSFHGCYCRWATCFLHTLEIHAQWLFRISLHGNQLDQNDCGHSSTWISSWSADPV